MTRLELVALTGFSISLSAMAVDLILPALGIMAAELHGANINSIQLAVSAVLLGSGVSPLFFGAWSERAGRRTPFLAGVLIFMLGSLLSLFAQNLHVLLAGRFLQGLGAAGPRVLGISILRDRFEGIALARTVSFSMAVFILVPAIAPLLGEFILLFGSWRAHFWFLLLGAILLCLWFGLRQPESLAPADRSDISASQIGRWLVDFLKEPSAILGTLTLGFMFAGFVAFLSTAQPIFQLTYQLGKWFSLTFSAHALTMGAAILLSSHLVSRFGVLKVACFAQAALIIGSTLLLSTGRHAEPALSVYLPYSLSMVFCFGLVFGNLNALAINRLGHMAGMGSALVTTVSALLAVPMGAWIAQHFSGSSLIQAQAFLLSGITSIIVLGLLVRQVGWSGGMAQGQQIQR